MIRGLFDLSLFVFGLKYYENILSGFLKDGKLVSNIYFVSQNSISIIYFDSNNVWGKY